MLKLYDDFYPKKSHPDMDWHDAMEVVADQAGLTRQKLDQFVIEHGAALSAERRVDLDRAISIASELNLEMVGVDPVQVRIEAEKLHDSLVRLRDALLDRVRSQAGS